MKSVGIDLGTTNSVVSVLEAGKATVIGGPVPSVVAFTEAGELVGDVAKRQLAVNPERTVKSVKRMMGSDWVIEVGDKAYTAQEISARILTELRRIAESYLEEEVRDVVITVPAFFDDSERTATREAGEIAGLNVLRIINEPTAAALAYGATRRGKHGTVLVYDLGGGTLDCSILKIDGGKFEVLSSSGDTQLGGDDWDEVVMECFLRELMAKHEDIELDAVATQRLREAAEKAKIDLSSKQSVRVVVPYLSGDVGLEMEFSRAKLEELTFELLQQTKGPLMLAMEDAGVTGDDLSSVLLVGGSTRMPAVRRAVKEWTGKTPDVSLNPEEVVSLGAAVQAGVITGEITDILLLDVTPLSLGVETKGGVTAKVVERNTTIPVRRTELFTTSTDGQTEVDIHIVQGERGVAKGNRSLGRFTLTGLESAPKGGVQIEVTFSVDVNGIVKVEAKDRSSGAEKDLVISGGTGLAEEEIERMIAEAKDNEVSDRRRAREVEASIRAASLLLSGKETLGRSGLLSEEKSELGFALTDLELAVVQENTVKILEDSERVAILISRIEEKVRE